MDARRLDSVLRYALAVAAESDDPRERDLGTIHLIKYAYLADLAHAGRSGGTTYTGVPWIFYHFGPWAREFAGPYMLGLVGGGICAESLRYAAADADVEFYRFRMDPHEAEQAVRALERELPVAVTSAVKRYVREFGKDTDGLLDHVYRTRPMLRAAPREALDFSCLLEQDQHPAPPPREPVQLTRRAEKKRAEALKRLRAEFEARRSRRAAGRDMRVPVPAPRYDEVFAEGQEALDRLAGEPLEAGTIEVKFSDDIWHSRGRAEAESS